MQRFYVGEPRQLGEGLRIGAIRYPPRGVKKKNYAKEDYFDVWMPVLAPSRRLMARRKGRDECDHRFWHSFFESYEREMREGTDARQTIQMLAQLSGRTPISVGCHCGEDAWCHVTVLMRLLEEAAAQPERGLGKDVRICKRARGRLFPQCVYTLVHPDKLEEIAGARDSQELERGQDWVTADKLVHEGMLVGQRVPVVFGDASDVSRLIGWGLLDCTDAGRREPSYWVSGVRKLRSGHRPQELVLVSEGRKIRPGYIRPYAICRTPGFLK